MPSFFVPMVDPDKQEAAYKELAEFAGATAQPLGSRIFSMTWSHNGVVWTATVGERLNGLETVKKGRGRDARSYERPRHTSDTVLAIYAGVPFLIMHDNKSRYWNVPILAGNPHHIVNFTA